MEYLKITMNEKIIYSYKRGTVATDAYSYFKQNKHIIQKNVSS